MPIALDVPFADNQEVSRLGARWDEALRRWIIPDGVDPAPLARWIASGQEVVRQPPRHTAPATEIPPGPGHNLDPDAGRGETLSALLGRVSAALRGAFPQAAWVRCEVSEWRPNRSGHIYAALVEHGPDGAIAAKADAMVWSNRARALSARFEAGAGAPVAPGIKVLVQVRVQHDPRFGLRLMIEDIDPGYTLGDMERRLREIRAALDQEGITGRNRALPAPPDFTHVAVVAPQDAAGLGDFRRDADRLEAAGLCRFQYFHAVFEGDRAPASVLAALRTAYVEHRRAAAGGGGFDAIAIIRGGGAKTALAWLNDPTLARAVCLCPLPILTGIGHERDDTVLDELARIRFDTPSKVIASIAATIIGNARQAAEDLAAIERGLAALLDRTEDTVHAAALTVIRGVEATLLAAEAAVERSADAVCAGAERRLAEAEARAEALAAEALAVASQRLDAAEASVHRLVAEVATGAERTLALAEVAVTGLADSAIATARAIPDAAEREVESLAREILACGPRAILERGYAIVRGGDGRPITSAAAMPVGQAVEIILRDGRAAALVQETLPDHPPARLPPGAQPRRPQT